MPGREDDREIEPERAPVDLPERGDPRLDRPAEHRHRQPVADLEAEDFRSVGVERNERRTGIVLRPPLPRDDLVARREGLRESQPAVAAQHPRALGDRRHVDHPRAVDRHHRPAQRRHHPSSAPGASRRTMARKRASSAAGISTRNKAGAWRGMFDCNSPSRLDPTPASITSSDRPRPRATDRRTVADPGRSSAAIPKPHQRPAAMPQPPRQPPQAEAQRSKGSRDHRRPTGPDGGELPVAGAVDGERHGRERRQHRHDQAAATTRSAPFATSPRSTWAGRSSTARATGPQLAAIVTSSPNRPASANASGWTDRSGASGRKPAATSAISAGAAAPIARPMAIADQRDRRDLDRQASPRPSAAARRAISRWR